MGAVKEVVGGKDRRKRRYLLSVFFCFGSFQAKLENFQRVFLNLLDGSERLGNRTQNFEMLESV